MPGAWSGYGVVANLSVGGCFLEASESLPLGARVRPRWTPKTGAVSCERRNISAIIRATGSGEARCSVNEQTMEGD